MVVSTMILSVRLPVAMICATMLCRASSLLVLESEIRDRASQRHRFSYRDEDDIAAADHVGNGGTLSGPESSDGISFTGSAIPELQWRHTVGL